MRRLLVIAATVGLLAGCPKEGGSSDEAEQALAETEAAARKLGKTLKERLLSAVKEDGPAGAAEMCSAEAQGLTRKVAERTDVRVGRSSLRLRNPDNEGPAWVMRWLKEQGERKAKGVEGFARVADTPQGREARVLKPLAIEGPCVNCHGPRDQLPEGVRSVLAQEYPEDEATGYELGDLRGALWASQPVP